MIEKLVKNKLAELRNQIDLIDTEKTIDCITIFPSSEVEYSRFNSELIEQGTIVDKMSSGNLFLLNKGIETEYGILRFIKVRIYEEVYAKYGLSIDFAVNNYDEYVKSLANPTIKKYETFELVQHKTDSSIINVVSLSASEEYINGR